MAIGHDTLPRRIMTMNQFNKLGFNLCDQITQFMFINNSNVQYHSNTLTHIKGVIAMIDEGETDWKIVCIDRNDPLAPQLNDIGYTLTNFVA